MRYIIVTFLLIGVIGCSNPASDTATSGDAQIELLSDTRFVLSNVTWEWDPYNGEFFVEGFLTHDTLDSEGVFIDLSLRTEDVDYQFIGSDCFRWYGGWWMSIFHVYKKPPKGVVVVSYCPNPDCESRIRDTVANLYF